MILVRKIKPYKVTFWCKKGFGISTACNESRKERVSSQVENISLCIHRDVFRSAPYPRVPTPLIDSVQSVTRPDLSAGDTATFVDLGRTIAYKTRLVNKKRSIVCERQEGTRAQKRMTIFVGKTERSDWLRNEAFLARLKMYEEGP